MHVSSICDKIRLINFQRIQFLSNMYQMHNNVFVTWRYSGSRSVTLEFVAIHY